LSKRTATTVAKSLGITANEFLKHAAELGHEIKSATAPLDEKLVNELSVKVAMKLAGVPVGATIIRSPKKRKISTKKKVAKKTVVKKAAVKKMTKKVTLKAVEEEPEEEAAEVPLESLVEAPVEEPVAAPVEEPTAAVAEPPAETAPEPPVGTAAETPAEEAAPVEAPAPAAEAPKAKKKLSPEDLLGPNGEAVVIKWPEKPVAPAPKKRATEKRVVGKEKLESLAAELAGGTPAAAPAKPVKKKVIKKIIRKVIRRRQPWPRRGEAPVQKAPMAKEPPKEVEPAVTEVKIEKLPTVAALARMFHKSTDALRVVLDDLGVDSHADAELDEDAILILGQEMGIKIELALPEPEPEHLEPRPPVVTVMGHVDHGKTSVLDAIRDTQIASGESGGITQHIGASKVVFKDQIITFIDTPGHEAFTAMRQRGATTTDLVVLVVAADDGIMPQTVEAINHAGTAGVPILVAVNKCDLPAADPDRVKRQLAERGVTPEDWGGQTIMCNVSALTKEGLDHLLEMILLQAEIFELRANPTRRGEGTVIESHLDPGRGAVASVIVRNGTLRVGDFVASSEHFGKVKALLDDRGKLVGEAAASIPVEILGLDGCPPAGAGFRVMKSEKQARRAAEAAKSAKPSGALQRAKPTTLEELFGMQTAGDKKELNAIIKADVQGSVEALAKNLESLSTDKAAFKVVHSNVGDVNVSDVMLASASDASIIGFCVKADSDADEAAKRNGVPMFFFDVIYRAIDSIRQSMENLLDPEIHEVEIGQVEVREVFESSSFGLVAGCYVRSGLVQRNAKAKLLRNDEVLWAGQIASLRRFKDEVREVQNSYECGIRLDGWSNIEVGDSIRIFKHEKVAQTL